MNNFALGGLGEGKDTITTFIASQFWVHEKVGVIHVLIALHFEQVEKASVFVATLISPHFTLGTLKRHIQPYH